MPAGRFDGVTGEGAPTRPTWFLYAAALLSAVGGFLFGYDTGVVSGALLQLRVYFKLNTLWQELIVSITIAGAWGMAVLAGKINDYFGRKLAVILASVLFTIGSILMAVAESHWTLFAGRLVVGTGVGLSSMTVPLYIAEVSPTEFRGQLVTINQLFITAGQFLAAITCGIFSYDQIHGWRFMLGLAGIPAILQLVGFLWMPESPRWLCGKGKMEDAYNSLRKLRGTDADIEEEFKDIQKSSHSTTQGGDFILGKVWKDRFLRKRLIVGCGLMVFQQLCAINTVMYYSATIIEMSGFHNQGQAIWLAAGVAFFNFAFSFVGVYLVERVGRRTLTLSSLAGVTFALALLSTGFYLGNKSVPSVVFRTQGAGECSTFSECHPCAKDENCAFYYEPSSMNTTCVLRNITPKDGWIVAKDFCPVDGNLVWITFSGLALYLVFFAPGMGPMPWTMNSEMFPLWCRSTCFSLATSFNWIFNLLVSMTFLTISESLTQQGAFFLYMILSIIGWIFFYFLLPETKGTSLENVAGAPIVTPKNENPSLGYTTSRGSTQ